jgi:hypothetical protein
MAYPSYTDPTQRSLGTLITASIYNTDIVDNIKALRGEIHYIAVEPFSMVAQVDVEQGDGKAYLPPMPAKFANAKLVEVKSIVDTAGVTGNMDIDIYNVDKAQDMLSSAMRIETGETSNETSAQPGTIDTGADDVDEWDILRIDFTTIQTTPAKGCLIVLGFQIAEGS